MKIVNRKTFLELPINTMYSHYSPCVIDDLMIKYDSFGNDWRYQNLIGNVKCNSSDEYFDNLIKAEEYGSSFDLDFYFSDRDGMFKENQLFVIYEKKDIKQFINRLIELL